MEWKAKLKNNVGKQEGNKIKLDDRTLQKLTINKLVFIQLIENFDWDGIIYSISDFSSCEYILLKAHEFPFLFFFLLHLRIHHSSLDCVGVLWESDLTYTLEAFTEQEKDKRRVKWSDREEGKYINKNPELNSSNVASGNIPEE